MRMSKVFLTLYRSVSDLDFEVGPFTVLFGKNNAGKTNLLEAIYGVLAPQDLPGGAAPLRDLRGHGDPDVVPAGAVYVELERGLSFDDAVMAMIPAQNAGQNVSELPSGRVCFVNIDKESELWFV